MNASNAAVVMVTTRDDTCSTYEDTCSTFGGTCSTCGGICSTCGGICIGVLPCQHVSMSAVPTLVKKKKV